MPRLVVWSSGGLVCVAWHVAGSKPGLDGGVAVAQHGRTRTASTKAVLIGMWSALTLVGCTGGASTQTSTAVEAVPTELLESMSEAELQDIQTYADQTGQSLSEAIAEVGWHDDFSNLIEQIRTDHPDTFVAAEITGDRQATISFTSVPGGVQDLADAFEAEYSVEVQIDGDGVANEQLIEVAVPTVHMAVYSHPDVLDATTGYEPATNQIITTVQLSDTAAPGLIDELHDVANQQLSQTAGIPDDITALVRESPGPLGGGDDSGHP